MISAQGGDPDAELPKPQHVHVVAAGLDGVLSSMDAYAVGVAAWRLGAGRARRGDPVQYAAGILCRAKPGDRVVAGQPLLELHTDTPDAVPAALASLDGGLVISETTDAPATGEGIVLETITT
jgi:thymidine phosphorylase